MLECSSALALPVCPSIYLSVCLSARLAGRPAGPVSVRSAEGVCSRGLCARPCVLLGWVANAPPTQVYEQRAGAAKELQDELQGRLARQDGELATVRAKVGAGPGTQHHRRAGSRLCQAAACVRGPSDTG